MKSLIVILTGLGLCWFFTDVRSESGFFNLLMPLGCVLFAIAFFIWLAFALASRRISESRNEAPTPVMPESTGRQEPSEGHKQPLKDN